MATAESLQEVIVLFDPAASTVVTEMSADDFDELLAGERLLEGRAASTVRAAYVQVGTGLAVRAVVFFQVSVDARGYIDPAFNVPLEYMAHQAGAGPDLGAGRINMACRSQCPIPWHSVNLWEPAGWDETHSAMEIQKAVWRNRLSLKVLPVAPAVSVATDVNRPRRPQDAVLELDEAMRRKSVARQALEERMALQRRQAEEQRQAVEEAMAQAVEEARALEAQQALDQRQAQEHLLTAAVGEARRIGTGQSVRQHREFGNRRDQYARRDTASRREPAIRREPAVRRDHGAELKSHQEQTAPREQASHTPDQFRSEMQRQQQGYLEQINACRDEIQRLKASLRYEQERNRRLQQLLRGDL
jgi:hypothetical protein